MPGPYPLPMKEASVRSSFFFSSFLGRGAAGGLPPVPLTASARLILISPTEEEEEGRGPRLNSAVRDGC